MDEDDAYDIEDTDEVPIEDSRIVGALMCRPSDRSCASTMLHKLGSDSSEALPMPMHERQQVSSQMQERKVQIDACQIEDIGPFNCGARWRSSAEPQNVFCGSFPSSDFPCQQMEIAQGAALPWPYPGIACPGVSMSLDHGKNFNWHNCSDPEGTVDCSEDHKVETYDFVCRPSASPSSKAGSDKPEVAMPAAYYVV
jgi:hypothetical protein